jgi:hypothetical protein
VVRDKEAPVSEPNINRLKNQLNEHCSVLGVAPFIQTCPQHDGSPHVEIKDGRYHYIITDRGNELAHKITDDEDEIMYWLVSDVVFGMACTYELENRIKGQSFRRLLFSKQIELMKKVNPNWAKRTEKEIEAILEAHPYDDKAEG